MYDWRDCTVVQFLIVFTLVDHSPITLGKYVYPDWADGIGWLMFSVVVLMIPLIAVIEIIRARQAHPFLSLPVSSHRFFIALLSYAAMQDFICMGC